MDKKTDFVKFTEATVQKVDEGLGLVMGFALICKQNDEDYFDLQGDHIPEDAMLEAATDFMLNSRKALEMHQGEQMGEVVFAFPLTTDVAEAFGITTKTTGLMIAMKPDSDEVLEKFRTGEYRGFSMGGKYVENEVVE